MTREIRLYVRDWSAIVNTALFFMMIMVFFPLSMPSESAWLRKIMPGLIWIAMLFALFLSSERLFQQDYEDGVIEQWLVSSCPISICVSSKILVHWFINLVSMCLLAPLVALLFHLGGYETLVMLVSLACGAPAIISLCALSVVFGMGLQQKGILMALILMPLTIPLLIFGSAAIQAALQQLPAIGYLAILLGISLLALVCLPFAVACVIRTCLLD